MNAGGGPLGEIDITSHIAQMFLHQSQSVIQSLESRQRQFYTLLLSNRNDQAYLSRMVDAQTADETAASSGSTPKPRKETFHEKSLSIKKSEIEVVASDLSGGQQSNLFTSLGQAKLYKLMLKELRHASDELSIDFINYLLQPSVGGSFETAPGSPIFEGLETTPGLMT